MPSLVGRPGLELPLAGMGMGTRTGADSHLRRYGLTAPEYPLLRMEGVGAGERKMGTEMRMLTEMPMAMINGGGYRYASSDGMGMALGMEA